jgi:hypothetical protein
MPIIRANKDFPPEHETWQPLSDALRNTWCAAIKKYPPIFLGATVMVMTNAEVGSNGYTDSGDWIELGKEFNAAGFTPEEFVALNDSVRTDARANPFGSPTPATYVTNSLVTVSGTANRTLRMIRLRASDWLGWLERVRSGEAPGTVAHELLAPHWGEPTEVVHV